MKLPVAVQAALDRSESEFQSLLGRLGLDRASLATVSQRSAARIGPAARRPAGPRPPWAGRGRHV